MLTNRYFILETCAAFEHVSIVNAPHVHSALLICSVISYIADRPIFHLLRNTVQYGTYEVCGQYHLTY